MQIVLSHQHTRFMSQFYLWLHLPDKELSANKVNQRTSNILQVSRETSALVLG